MAKQLLLSIVLLSIILMAGSSVAIEPMESLQNGCETFVNLLKFNPNAEAKKFACLASYYKMLPAFKAYEKASRQFGGRADFDSIEKNDFIAERVCN